MKNRILLAAFIVAIFGLSFGLKTLLLSNPHTPAAEAVRGEVGRIIALDPSVTETLYLLGLEGNLPWSEGEPIPVAEHYDLEVKAPGAVVVGRGERVVAKATGDSHYFFRGLERGGYTVEAGGKVAQVPLNGDTSLDLTPGSGWLHLPRWDRKVVGAFLILMINLIGAAMIIRIVRRG